MHRLRGAALCAVVSLAGALLATTPATASQPTTALVLQLKPTSETGLHTLAVSHGLPRAERARRLAALTPNADRRDVVADTVRSLGLSVDYAAQWSLRVHGPSTTVASLFGALAPASTDGSGRAYPLVPAALDPYVVAALPTSGRVAQPLATASPRTGADFRNAYSAPPGGTGSGVAVATVQLSGWRTAAADLDTYARNNHINGFSATNQYVAVSVDGARTDENDGQGGDEEVALDQDAILTTAPDATQVAYFASNLDGGNGYVDAIRQVGKEAAAHHTVALSLSWGGCEASDDRKWVATMDSALAYTLAAGFTIFAASGDAASRDCIDVLGGSAGEALAVDYPASSPYAVGVGGSSLRTSGSTSVELGWEGSGGGESAYEALPTWQFGVASHSPNNRRLVPDIASDADPDSGLTIYDSALPSPHTDLLAGTSLASPTQASLLADTLSASSTTVGVGDIHAALYQGAANGAVADITSDVKSWGNGTYHSAVGYDLVTGLGSPVWTKLQSWLGQFDMRAPRATRTTSFGIQPTVPTGTYSQWSVPLTTAPAPGDCSSATASAAPTSVQLPSTSPDGTYTFWVAGGSDVPAAGSCHIGQASVVLDRQAPRTTLTLQPLADGYATARWTFADSGVSSALQKFVVVATSANATQWTYTSTNRSRVFNAMPHGRWRLRVTAYDNAGNASTAAATLYDDSTAFSFGARWTRVSSNAAYRRGFERARRVGSSARTSVTGKQFVLYVEKCRTCGRVGVYDGHGRHLITIDTYSATTRYRVPVTVLTLPHVGTRTLAVRVLSGKNVHSTGHDVDIDALAVY